MDKYEVLESLKRLFDHTTAEREDKLPEFFVELPIYKDLTEGRHDIILGAKGSGKSAILLMLHHSWKSGKILQDVYLLKATEHEGDPAFAEAFRDIEDVDESRMVNAWRAYFLNLLYRELDAFVPRKDLKKIRRIMEESGCIIEEPGPLEKLWSWIITNFVPRVVRFGVSRMTADGSLSASVADLELGKGDFVPAKKNLDGTDLVLAFRKLNSVMTRDTWILLDRLDNVYPGDRAVERKVMRALLEAYRSIMYLERIKIKMFLREDIFLRATEDSGFRNLDHITDRASRPIVWNEEKVSKLITQRARLSDEFLAWAGLTSDSMDDDILRGLFPERVDKSEPIRWICLNVQDANNLILPRDVVKLMLTAVENEMESRNNANNKRPILSALSLRKSLEPLAYWKLQHFLRAEYPDTIPYLEKIKGKRSKMTRDEWEKIMGQETIRATEFLRRAGVIRTIADGTKIEVAKVYAKAMGMKQPWTRREP